MSSVLAPVLLGVLPVYRRDRSQRVEYLSSWWTQHVGWCIGDYDYQNLSSTSTPAQESSINQLTPYRENTYPNRSEVYRWRDTGTMHQPPPCPTLPPVHPSEKERWGLCICTPKKYWRQICRDIPVNAILTSTETKQDKHTITEPNFIRGQANE